MDNCNSKDIENGTCFDCGATGIKAAGEHQRGVRN